MRFRCCWIRRSTPIEGFELEKWNSAELKAGMKPSTCNRKLSALRGVFSRAIDWDILLKLSPMAKSAFCKAPNALASLARSMTTKAVRAECAADARNKRRITLATPERTYADYLKPATITACHTGVRLTEMLWLEWTNVDLERAIITVTDETTKSSKQRHIAINRDLLAVLIAWKAQVSAMFSRISTGSRSSAFRRGTVCARRRNSQTSGCMTSAMISLRAWLWRALHLTPCATFSAMPTSR
jgi:integrase